MDIYNFRSRKPTQTSTNTEEKHSFLNLFFANKGIDVINISNIHIPPKVPNTPTTFWLSVGFQWNSQSLKFCGILFAYFNTLLDTMGQICWIFKEYIAHKVIFVGLIKKKMLFVKNCSHLDKGSHQMWWQKCIQSCWCFQISGIGKP